MSNAFNKVPHVSDDTPEQARPRPRFIQADERVVLYPEVFRTRAPAPPVKPARRRATAKRPAKPKINYSVSRTPQLELAFRKALADAQQQGVHGIGGCMNMWDTKSEAGDYYIREGNLRLGGHTYSVSLYSLSRAPLPDERDPSFGSYRIQQGVGRIENEHAHKFEIYAPLRYGVAFVDDYTRWTVVNKTDTGRIVRRTLMDFVRNPAIDPDNASLGTRQAEQPGGFSYGSLSLPRDKRNLKIVPPAPVEGAPPVKKKTRKRTAKTPAKTVRKVAARAKPKRAAPAKAKPKPRRPR